MGTFCYHGNLSFNPIWPKTLCSLSPTPMVLHIKFDQDWPTGFRDIQVKKWNFCHSRASNSRMSGLIWPKIELNRAFMPVLGTSNFDDDSIKNEAWRHHFPIISLLEFFRRSRAANSVVSRPIRPKFKLIWDFKHILVTCKYKKDRIKSNWEKVETPFSPL